MVRVFKRQIGEQKRGMERRGEGKGARRKGERKGKIRAGEERGGKRRRKAVTDHEDSSGSREKTVTQGLVGLSLPLEQGSPTTGPLIANVSGLLGTGPHSRR